jgi:phosphatidylinositol alpha-1,6-mannosyltransferase
MRILAIVTEAFGGYGGIAQYNRDLLTAMSAASLTEAIEVLPRYARDEVGALPSKVRQSAPHESRATLSLRALELGERLRPDVVFCGHLHLAPLAASIARRHGSALICQTHGLEVWSRPGEVRRRGMETANAVLCVSRDTRARVLTWSDLQPERVRVVPNTVGAEFTPGDPSPARERLGVGDRKVILSVSRLDAGQRHKGQDRVIRLLPTLVAEGLDVVYLIAGEGDDARRVRSIANDIGVSDRVRLLGRVPQAELPELYRAADIFALPSTGDGFGIVYLEAMACGVPAVGLAVGGASDALADGELGILASEDDLANTLIRALTQGARDPSLPARVQARFGQSAFQSRIETIFAAVAANYAAPRAKAAA